MRTDERDLYSARLRAVEQRLKRQLWKVQRELEEYANAVPVQLNEPRWQARDGLFTWPWHIEAHVREDWYKCFPESTFYLFSVDTREGELLHYEPVTGEVLYLSTDDPPPGVPAPPPRPDAGPHPIVELDAATARKMANKRAEDNPGPAPHVDRPL